MKISKLVLAFLLVVSYASAQQKPNIVYIICDDLGYGDVQFLNPEKGKIKTPNIDAFAKESMTFTDAHSASARVYSIKICRFNRALRMAL